MGKLGREKYSFSKKIKNNIKKAVKFIGDFERTASELAIENNFDYVICGHIHQPQIREVSTSKGSCMYLNSGDWIENLTALEYNKGSWEIYHYENDLLLDLITDLPEPIKVPEEYKEIDVFFK